MTFWAPPSGRQSRAPPYVCVNQDVENTRFGVQKRLSHCSENLGTLPSVCWALLTQFLTATFPNLPLTIASPISPIFQPFLSEEIIGGHEAKPPTPTPTWLWFSIWVRTVGSSGGVLIQKDFVLTVAHCRGRGEGQ